MFHLKRVAAILPDISPTLRPGSWSIEAKALAGAVAIAVSIVYLTTARYGIGLTPDSITYFSVARNLASNGWLVSYDGQILSEFPPGYPILLAVLKVILGVDPMISARHLNAIFFGLIVILFGLCIQRFIVTQKFLVVAPFIIVLSIPLVSVSSIALTESIFIMVSLLFLLALEQFICNQSKLGLRIVAITVAIAPLIRYSGISLLPIALVAVGIISNQERVTKFRAMILVTAMGVLPLALWTTRNWILTSTLLGLRASSFTTLQQNGEIAIMTALSWFVPGLVLNDVKAEVGILIAVAVVIALVTRSLYLKKSKIPVMVILASIFAGTYGALLVISSTIVAYDEIDTRLLSPIYPAMAMLGIFAAERIYPKKAEISKQRITRYAMLLLLVAFLTHAVVSIGLEIGIRLARGAGGYNSIEWQESEIVNFLLERGANPDIVYSNAPDALYHLASIDASWSPAKRWYRSADSRFSLDELKQEWPAGCSVELVWFDRMNRDYLFTVDELATISEVQEVVRLSDGSISTISKTGCTN